MEEFYKVIEEKIKSSGCPIPFYGEDIYNDICDQIDGKEPGNYILLSKKGDDYFLEYQVDIFEEEFNLSRMDIHTQSEIYRVEFDR